MGHFLLVIAAFDSSMTGIDCIAGPAHLYRCL